MKIESVDLFYLSMPEVTTAADGSQDALVVRVRAGGLVGWGECEAAPLPSIAAFVCPMSHGACRPVSDAVLGERVEDASDIYRIAAKIEYDSMDLLQAPHVWSGIEMALWDLLGKARDVPVWHLLGYRANHRKTPYASVLFGADPQETLRAAQAIRDKGFLAAKFGWAPFGDSLAGDEAHVDAAREGLGPDAVLLVDAGQVFGADVAAAQARLPALARNGVTFLEEPFHGSAFAAYGELASLSGAVAIAGGEAAHNAFMAENLIAFGKVGVIQIDCGRIGGIGPAKRVADFAAAHGVRYLNHTFTSNLALSASLQPFAGVEAFDLCEYPAGLQPLARDLTRQSFEIGSDGRIAAPDAPGLGMDVDEAVLSAYGVDVEIRVGGRVLYTTPGI
ncbi:mandelate racemase/muconate lactonizing enzyme family protein [Oceanibium sediminis]|uniref:mandelate racemase/muconate lactonizing enzyme family protein n=1 Tax=Oceanibium sediminis TaxID=2026339 RepID=UPI000DD4B46B|nr:mandelate racemase/muconate lactonizing enzyme family protein [Oceanibium sediminis]